MRMAHVEKPSMRFSVRPVLLAVVAVAFAMVGLAMLAEAMSSDGSAVYLAKFTSGSQNQVVAPNIEVVGSGTATGPAEKAVIQLLVVRDVPFGDQAQSSSAATGTQTGVNGVRGSLTPVVNAMMAIGVAENEVVVLTSPALISVCNNYSRCSSARIDVTVNQPTLDRVNAIVNAVGSTAVDEGMTIQDIGVGYGIADCSTLTRTARQLATTDAQTRATDQAAVLGVDLGKLLLSSELAPDAPRDATGCPVVKSGYADSWWTAGSSGLSVPSFDPSAPPEATVTVQVALAFAIDDSATTTGS